MMVLDEVASMKNFFQQFQEILIPTLTDTKGEVLFISTPKGFNHFYELYNRELSDPEWKSFHFTTYDNPHIEPDEITKLKKQITEDRFSQEYLAEFKKTEGLVYKSFDRELDVTEEKPEYVSTTILGIDWGWTNPACILRIEVDDNKDFWIREEFYQS